MQFSTGFHVYTIDRMDQGQLTHVVLNPTTREISHIVMHRGVLFTEDKVIPIERVLDAGPDRVVLDQDEDHIEGLPDFEESYYAPVETEGRMVPTGSIMPGGNIIASPTQRYVKHTRQNIPDDSVALKLDAQVFGDDGDHIGHLASVLLKERTALVSHLVISRGLLLKTNKRLTAWWCKHFTEDEVHLVLNADQVDNLPEYQAEQVKEWSL